jgi:two-component system LytT family sensor kinase
LNAPRRAPPVWAFVSAAWLVPGLLAVFQAWMAGRLGEREPATLRTVAWEGGDWALYGLLTPFVFLVARRFPLSRDGLLPRLAIHLAASVLLCAAWAGGGVLLSMGLFGTPPYGGSAVGWFFTSLPFGVAVYFAVLGVERATMYFLEARERETQAARLGAQLAEARLSALRMQLQPHFLLNSLNAITVIVRDRDTTTATRLLEQLGDMLRRVVRTGRSQEVRLDEELDFVRRYLDIESARFPDRLQVIFEVDLALGAAAVPEFVLQPLVENAIRHGLGRRAGPTRLSIVARREAEQLVLSVGDEGTAPAGGPGAPGGGLGLANTRERLATLYGEGATLTLAPVATGMVATVRIPYRELPVAKVTGG